MLDTGSGSAGAVIGTDGGGGGGDALVAVIRSEERRVGKECSS